jgi:excisionase family DNA binding protein
MGTESLVLMTPSQVARELGVSADTVRDWADAGRLACLRTTAGHRLFLREEVERLSLERRVAVPPRRAAVAAPEEPVTPDPEGEP